MLSSILDLITTAPAWLLLVVVGAIVLAEDALFIGFVIPGETVAILGGVAARAGHVDLAAVLVTVVVAAVLGDSVGYEVGKHAGPRILALKVIEKRRRRLDDARDFLRRRGGSAVMLGRWVAFFRAVMPALAGTAGMPYGKFLAWNAAGGLLWGVVVVMAGYLAGESYARIEQYLGRGAAIAVLAVAAVGLVVWWLRRRAASDGEAT